MTRIQAGWANLLDRRQLLTAGGAGLGALALGSLGFAAAPRITNALQIAATPPAPPDAASLTTSTDPIAELAAKLDFDAGSIFAFVRDEVHYESYAGILRGGKGTLWSRAGNSADQAILLGELLAASQIPYRYAFGALTPETIERLGAQIAPSRDTARSAFDAAVVSSIANPAANEGASIATPNAPSPEEQEALNLAAQQSSDLKDRAATLIEATAATIHQALSRASITLPPLSPPTLPNLERSRHAWVQISDGPNWIDLDPSLAESDSAPTATSMAEEMPHDLMHLVRIRLVVEEVFGGYPSRRDLLTFASASHRLVNVPIALAMTSPSDMQDVGVTITDLFSGTVTFAPCLIAGKEYATVTSPMVFGADDGSGVIDALDGDTTGGLADGETIGVWLVAEVSSPESAPLTIERTLLDRVGPAARSSGTIDLTTVAPLTFVTDQTGQPTVPELAGLTIITTDVARLPTIVSIRDAISADLFGQLHLFGPAFTSFRNALVFEHGLAAGFDAYPTGPNLTAFTVNLIDPSSEQSGMEISADLLIQHPSLFALQNSGSKIDEISPFVVAGVINQVTEQVLIEPMATTADGDGVNTVHPSVGKIFEEAARAGIEIVAIAGPSDLASIPISEDARTSVQAAFDAGLVAVIPNQAVTISGKPRLGWWLIDPVTGRTWDQIEDGRGYAGGVVNRTYSLNLAQLTGYARLVNNVRTWAGPYIILGKCVGLVVANAALAADYSNSKDFVDAGIETFKNVNPKDAKDCF